MRAITHRTRGAQHGFIRRMVSPGDLGHALKPFVFLDFVTGHVAPGSGFGWHPHSGIATLTYTLNSDVAYEDTTGQKGVVEATGIEWMQAGEGTWHQGFSHPREDTVTGFQLWVALPPEHELGAPRGQYVAPLDVPQVDNVRVLLGEYGGEQNPIQAPSPMLYLDVTLAAGESWRFEPPPGHTIAWAMVYRGTARLSGASVTEELVVFEPSTEPVLIVAVGAARVLFGSAQRHDHPLVLGSHSVHTSEPALRQAVTRIRAVGAALRAAGRF